MNHFIKTNNDNYILTLWNTAMKRNISLDFIKIVAMYCVMALHIGYATRVSPCFLSRHWWSVFGVAIPLFFMVSGYLMESKKTDYEYSFRKVFGILKYVFITMTPFVIIELIRGNLSGLKFYYSWIKQDPPLGAYWYFAAMIIVYLLLPQLKKIMKIKHCFHYLIILFVVCQIVFVSNVIFDFERKYICQTFRIWNWLFYFSLGMLVNRHQDFFNRINWAYTVLAGLGFIFFRSALHGYVGGNEYYFCSFPNMIYVLCLFVCLNKVKFTQKGGRVISLLSTVFLPVYTIHWPIFLYCKSHSIHINVPEPNLYILINYLAFSIVITIISLLLMRLPYADRVFRI